MVKNLLLAGIIVFGGLLRSQTCANVNFELGNLSGWTVTSGQPTGFNNLLMTGCCPNPGSPEAIIRTTPFIDTHVGTVPHSPLGGTKVLMLNDSDCMVNTGLTSRVSTTMVVTPGSTNFQYAISAYVGGLAHPCTDYGYANVRFKDGGGTVFYANHFIPSSPTGTCVPAVFTNTVNNTAFFCWQTFTVNLAPYIGTSVSLEVSAGDCTGWGHFGYCYFDALCSAVTPTMLPCGIAMGVNENNVPKEFSIYPNPAKDILNISLPGNSQHAELIIYDLLGKIVLKQNEFSETTSINIRQLNSGAYFYKFSDGENIKTGKFIKE